jgi:multidrug efflux pump
MKAIIDAALDRSRMVLLLLALIFVVGSITYATIPKESNPDVAFPYVYASVVHEGISPEDSERLLVRPMETALRSIEGVKEMNAQAAQGFGSVTLKFDVGVDPQKALRDVRRKIDEVKSKLPTDGEEPQVHEVNAALFPVLVITLSGPVPERTLLALARNLKDDLAGVKGVLEVDIGGNREEMVEISIDPLKMDSYGISQDELFNLFSRNNRLIAAGTLQTSSGQFAIKLPGVLESVQDVQNLPVKVAGGRVVKFSDIATITRAFKDPTSFARRDGQPAVTLEVKKRIGENVIETIERVRASVAEHQKHWSGAVQVTYSQDESKDIKDMLNDLQNGVLTAVILVVCVLIGYLGWRTASLVAVAVPGSFLIGIIALAVMGLTVNMVVLFSLIMAVGMLVDDAIVVSEYADRRMCEGAPSAQAYRDATKRMFWPVVASTVTRLAAFFPLIFWPGLMGGFMKFLPITLLATLTASLVMAMVFIPTLGAIWGQSDSHSMEEQQRIAAAETGRLEDISGPTRHYLRVLTWAVDAPGRTFMIAVSMLVAIYVTYGVCVAFHLMGAGLEFFPESEPNNIIVNVHARGDLSVYEKDALVRDVEKRIRDLPYFTSVYARSGTVSDRQAAADTVGMITLELKDWQQRPKADAVIEQMRARTAGMPGAIIEVVKEANGPSSGKPVQIELSSPVPESLPESNARLGTAVQAMREAMGKVGGFTDIEDTRPLDGIEWQLAVDRAEAAKFGADITLVGNAVQLVTNGVLLGKYRPEDADDEVDIRARYTPPYRNLQQLSDLKIETRNGLVPVTSFVERKAAPKVNSIRRIDGKRVLQVMANLSPGVLADSKVQELGAYFQQHPYKGFIDGSVRFRFRGQQEDMAESQAFLSRAFGLAIFLMIVILVTQFNSFYQTLLILSAILFSTAAVFLGLLILRSPFGIVMGGLGVISLAGIICNNNIILIDTYNHLRHEGMPAREAVLRTGMMRLRPVLLTAGTAILGLLPMAFALNFDIIHRVVTYNAPSSLWWIQLASAVAGGLAFATPITLILTPALLMWRARQQDRKLARKSPPGVLTRGASA